MIWNWSKKGKEKEKTSKAVKKKAESKLLTEYPAPGKVYCQNRTQEKLTRLQRLKIFKHTVKFGAIFICSFCHQRLFQNGVTVITNTTRSFIEGKKIGLFDEAIKEVTQNINGRSASYLCHTYKRT